MPAAIAALNALEEARLEYIRPADDAAILNMLEQIAQTFQVELPQADGLAVYVACLQDVPARFLTAAMVEVAKSHTYRTMPLPGEFLKTAPALEWRWQFELLGRIINEKKAVLVKRQQLSLA